MRPFPPVPSAAAALTAGGPLADADALSADEQHLVHAVNALRADPPAYARRALLPLRACYQADGALAYGEPGDQPLTTTEGVAALDACIAALLAAAPVPALVHWRGMSAAACDHLGDQARSGATGHAGADGSASGDRLSRHGRWSGLCAEVISYGNHRPERVLAALLIDDGVPGRGHRLALLDARHRAIGVAIGPHPGYRSMAVITLAAGWQP